MPINKDQLVGLNIERKAIKVRHADLQRTDDSAHKSICPACKEGVLLMMRDQQTFKLRNTDRCILCAQAFIYTDVPDNELKWLGA